MPTTASRIYTNVKLEPFMNPEEAKTIIAKFLAPGGALGYSVPRGTLLAESATLGVYRLYGPDGTVNGAIATGASSGVMNAFAGLTPGESIHMVGEAAAHTIQTVSANGLNFTFTPVIAGAGVAGNAALTHDDVAAKVAKAIMQYDAQIDANGLVTLSPTAGQVGGDQAEQLRGLAIYISGTFFTGDLAGLDANALTNLGARLIEGSLTNGVLRLP